MSINFHANQYEQAFTPHKTQNWEVPKNIEGKYPEPNTGFTRIKANDKGHLLPNVPRERSSPWGSFVGTWDIPNKVPGNRITNPTARSEKAVEKGTKLKETGTMIINGKLKKSRTVDPLPIKMEAPENQVPVGMVCEPIGGGAGVPPTSMEPCIQTETTHYKDNQPRAMSKKVQYGLKWPQAKSPSCNSPVGHARSPKPVTPMALADVDVQRVAEQMISPQAPQHEHAVMGALKTPGADLQNLADKPPSPQDRMVSMKSATDLPHENALVS